MLLGIKIQNFALLQDFSFGLTCDDLKLIEQEKVLDEANCFPLTRLSAIIGRNNSGKTLLFEALDFLADSVRFSVPFAANLHGRGGFQHLHTRGKEDDMSFQLLYLPPWKNEILQYDLMITVDKHGRPQIRREEVLRHAVTQASARVIKGTKEYRSENGAEADKRERCLLTLSEGRGQVWHEKSGLQEAELVDNKTPGLSTFGKQLQFKELRALYSFISQIFFLRSRDRDEIPFKNADELSQGGHKHINSYGTNVRNVLSYVKEENPQEYRDIMKKIEESMPRNQRMGDLTLDRDINNGERKLFTILLLLLDPRPKPLVMLENPDASLYHEMVESMGQALRNYVMLRMETQLFFSTHSTILLEGLAPREVWVLQRERRDEQRSYLQLLEDSVTLGSGRRNGQRAVDPGTSAHCIAESTMVRSMYAEGIGLGALWYSGHFDAESDH